MKRLGDDDTMLWGKKHKGKKLKDVPLSYLRWMHDTWEAGEVTVGEELLRYIKLSLGFELDPEAPVKAGKPAEARPRYAEPAEEPNMLDAPAHDEDNPHDN